MSPHKCLLTALFHGSNLDVSIWLDRANIGERAEGKRERERKKGETERSIPRGNFVRDRREPRRAVSNRSNCSDAHVHAETRAGSWPTRVGLTRIVRNSRARPGSRWRVNRKTNLLPRDLVARFANSSPGGFGPRFCTGPASKLMKT